MGIKSRKQDPKPEGVSKRLWDDLRWCASFDGTEITINSKEARELLSKLRGPQE